MGLNALSDRAHLFGRPPTRDQRCRDVPIAKRGKRSVKKFPCLCPIEAFDEYGLQERGRKIAQVYSVAIAGRRFKRLPMGNDAARLAAHISQGSIAPDVALRAFGMAFDGHGPKRVISPYPSRAPA